MRHPLYPYEISFPEREMENIIFKLDRKENQLSPRPWNSYAADVLERIVKRHLGLDSDTLLYYKKFDGELGVLIFVSEVDPFEKKTPSRMTRLLQFIKGV